MKRKRVIFTSCVSTILLIFTGCGQAASADKPDIHIEEYQMKTYESAEVQKGDISSVLELTLKPDDYSSLIYQVDRDDLVVESVNVAVGDRVEEGDVMVKFEADEIEELIETYTNQKEEDQLLIDHYTKLMAIDSSQDYTEDIESLKLDMQIAELYVEEQTERLSEYTLTAEKAGTITYMDEWLNYGYVTSNTNIITVVSGSSDYIATTYDTYEFNVGDVYQAGFGIAVYDMQVVEVTQSVNEATGRDMQTILFEPLNDMSAVSESDELSMEIEKPTIEDVVYVDSDAVIEDEGLYYVYVLSEDGYRMPVQVTIGDELDELTIIESGLEGGEQVTLN